MASPSTYRLNMQNTAAIKTVSWISRSVAAEGTLIGRVR